MKVVIAGSASLQKEIAQWKDYWRAQGAEILDFPKSIPASDFINVYPDIHKSFYKNIGEANIFFVANEDKKGIVGYIGAEAFAELAYAVAQKLLHGKKTKIILAKMPSPEVQSFEEIILWQKLNWIDQIIN